MKQLLLLGREHFQRGDYDRAEYLLKQVVNRAGRLADVLDMLGVIAHSRGDFSGAETFFRRAIELNPHYTEAQINLAITYNELGRYGEASALTASVEGGAEQLVNGKIANLHASTAQAYEDAGRLRDAIAELEKGLALSPRFSDLRVRMAKLLREVGDGTRAASELSRALEITPHYVAAHLELSRLHLSEGRNREALEALKPLDRLSPHNPQVHAYRNAAERSLAAH